MVRRLYPEAVVALHFHGGVPTGSTPLDDPARVFSLLDVVFTNTRASASQAVALGCPPERIVLRPMGLDLDEYPYPTERVYRPGGTLRIISVGRLSPEKGLSVALAAVRLLVDQGFTELRYRIVGDGVARVDLEEEVRRLGLEAYVSFEGERTKDQVISLLADSDVLLLPSLTTPTWAETQAVVAQEAMLTGLVVIGTSTGGIPESVAPELTRFLVPAADEGAIAWALRSVLGLPQSDWRRLGKAAREWTKQRYGIDVTTSTFLDAIRALREGSAPNPSRSAANGP